MRWRRHSAGSRLLGLCVLALATIAFAVLVSPAAATGATAADEAEPGWLRRMGRRVKGIFRRHQHAQGTSTAVTQGSLPIIAGTVGGHSQQPISGISDGRPGRLDSQSTESIHPSLRGRQGQADPAKIVWQSLSLPHFRSSKVQNVLEYWHMEAAIHLLDSYHLQELLRSYMTVLDWASKLFFPDMEDTIRSFTNGLVSTVLDVDVCSKRLLYLSVVPVVASRGSESSDIDLRKTKALHTLGVFYVLQGRLAQLSSLMRESSKMVCKELTKRHTFTAQMAKILMPFTRLARYSLDSLDYLMEYYRELRAAIMGSIVYPLLVTRTYSRLHRSLQTAGQFFATCLHARKIGASLQHDLAELRGVTAGAA